ncbi:hypothetical protein BGX28_003703 [Mortierella sp. GBA30]|nr:hypothetical protein BGX28_003703 [Mortierella sp. GBA30]
MSPIDGACEPESIASPQSNPKPLSSEAASRSRLLMDTLSPTGDVERTAASEPEQTCPVSAFAESNESTTAGATIKEAKGREEANLDVAMPVSYFNYKNISQEETESHPSCPENENEKPLKGPTLWRNRSRPSSKKSSSSESSDSSASSAESSSDSDSDSSDSGQLSPISGASFFSSPPNASSTPTPSNLSTAPLNSGGMQISNKFKTLLPNGIVSKSAEDLAASLPSPSTTPPTTPPLEQADTMSDGHGPAPAPSKLGFVLADPRALTLKRQAYIHTLRKLREREKRPFRHAVLLHLILLQLRRGVTNEHCNEIGRFYAAMSAAQFPPRLDLANALITGHHFSQGSLLQLHQEREKNGGDSSQSKGGNQGQELPVIPERSASKSIKKPKSKSKRSLVLSIQSRIQSSKTLGGSADNNNSNSVVERDSSSPPSASSVSSIFYPPTQLSSFKDRLPLLRIPTNPLISLEKKLSEATIAATARKSDGASASSAEPITPPSSDPSDSEEDDEEDEEVDEDDSDKVDFAPSTPTVIIPKRTTGRKGLLYQQQMQFQLQLQQQLQNEAMFGLPDGQNPMRVIDQEGQKAAAAWIQAQLNGKRRQFATSTYTTGETLTSQRAEAIQAGLLTPPLSPLLRSSFSSSSQPAPSPISTVSAASTSWGPSKLNEAALFKTATAPTPYGSQSYVHPRNGGVSSPYAQNMHSANIHIDGSTAAASRNAKNGQEGFTAPLVVSARQRHKSHPAEKTYSPTNIAFNSIGLPSPPHSPTLESEEILAAPLKPTILSSFPSSMLVKGTHISSSSLSGSMGHSRRPQRHASGGSICSSGRFLENGPLINQIPSSQVRHSFLDDARTRSRKQQQMQMMMKMRSKKRFSNGGNHHTGEESEEDVPLALVQKRISCEMVRS